MFNRLVWTFVYLVLIVGLVTGLFLNRIGNTPQTQLKAQGAVFAGTGFFVQDQIILTARHVVAGYKEISVLYDGKWYPAEVIAQDRWHDLALLRVNTGHKTPYAVLGKAVDKKEVVIKGYDLGQTVLKTHKAVFDFDSNQDGLNAVRTKDEICRGDSGGPVIDSSNKVVGVEVAGSTDPEDVSRPGCSRLGLTVKPENVQGFLNTYIVQTDRTDSTITIVYIKNITN